MLYVQPKFHGFTIRNVEMAAPDSKLIDIPRIYVYFEILDIIFNILEHPFTIHLKGKYLLYLYSKGKYLLY